MAIEKKFFVDINLQGNALNNATVGSNSNMTKAGSFQYNSVDNRLEYFNGSIIETVANLGDVTGALDFQGGYDAATNTPDLTTPAAGAVKQGYYYVVTVEGTFFGKDLAVGDSLFAKVDDPASLDDWTLVQGNVVIATESVDGIVRLATQTEVNDGTESGAVVVTPATLQGKIDDQITPEINNKLPLAGGTMSGNIDMNSNNITNLAGPTEIGDAANKDYVDTKSAQEAESAVNASSYTITIPTSAWETDGTYYWTISNHPLGKFVNVSVFENSTDPQNVEFNYQLDAIYIILRSNILPTDDIIVCLNKASGNLQ